ncbi:protein indeterminate-domain 4, chloroplastic-like [Prosopis cineraria]|uniref:protein indeterminate-domain 4, chloroplastic-like n=1 Tax=Prosopis cineraria TaxID=364024 RepID=UPI00240EACE9|nr:protein indeterminate-domain 4, chloroplastic-like [Prosopis cineraria]XP_054825419.1 protein indeterminate-domain 4, chloroplastic-like [Prosopis cineraria]
MSAASSSSPFFGIREENPIQMTQQHHQSSTAASSTAPNTVVPQKKRRNQPGTPNPDAEVIALSPKTLMATNRFICEVCNKGFQREQNLQLHRRGHNLPWKLKQKTNKEPKRKVYLCPEPTCVHHDPSRALGDLTGIKKHYSRKHGEKKWKCEKCSKKYAVQSDWKAHSKTCGTREYRCDCGTLFSRRDSFITHRAFCDALAQESARNPTTLNPMSAHNLYGTNYQQVAGSTMSHHLHHQNLHAPATNPNTSILRLGNANAAKFEPSLISPSSNPSMPNNSSAFFMTDPIPNQGFHQEHHHHHHPSQQQAAFSSSSKASSIHGLMQLPDLQGNPSNNNSSSNPFNLGFFPNNSMISDQFSNPIGDHHHVGSGLASSVLFGNSIDDVSPAAAHMSATALLQKAAQMGSTTTTSNNGSSSLLRGMGCSSTNNNSGAKSDNLATFGSDVTENDHHQHLRGLMNSLANGNHSIFGNVQAVGNDHQANSLQQNLGVSFGGSDKLTLDFLGVGGMVRNMNGGFSQRSESQQHGSINMSSPLEPEQASQTFRSTTLQ